MVLVSVMMGTNACDRTAKEPDPALMNRALVWGEMRGREVAFIAQELTMLHPNSDRSQYARRMRLQLDGVLSGNIDEMTDDDPRGESAVEDKEEE